MPYEVTTPDDASDDSYTCDFTRARAGRSTDGGSTQDYSQRDDGGRGGSTQDYSQQDDGGTTQDYSHQDDGGTTQDEASNVAAASDSDVVLLKTPPHVRGGVGGSFLDRACNMRRAQSNMPSPDTIASMSNDMWDVRHHDDGTGKSPFVVLADKHGSATYRVYHSRVGKAMVRLSRDDCLGPMHSAACECSRQCNRLILCPDFILAFRVPVFVHCMQESAVFPHVVAVLKAQGNKYQLHTKYSHKGQDTNPATVCRKYYACVHGVSVLTCTKAMKAAKAKALPVDKASRISPDTRESPKYIVAYAFWNIFFGDHCQKPNDDVRLFPVAKPYDDVFREYFEPWFQRLVQSGDKTMEEKPSQSTWRKARRDPDFNDVKKPGSHTHSRCAVCSTLKALLLKTFADGACEREYQMQRRVHDDAVRAWRKLEEVMKAQAVNKPDENLTIMHDGTSALGIPRLTRRTIKNLDPYRLEVIPWLVIDYSKGSKDYIYSMANSTAKDANTLITQVHASIKKAKTDYKHKRHRARTLTLVADSASENKNNTLFAYCTELVNNGWFDEVLLYFGPVGHTHNGVDATHKVHNQNVASYMSGDFGEFVFNYAKGFSGPKSGGTKRPQASILARTLNWTQYYLPCLRAVKGFTKSKLNPEAVRGFRIMKQKNGTTDVTWKVDPALEEHWRGEDGFPNTPGFFVLTSIPVGVPEFVIPPPQSDEAKKMAQKLRNARMSEIMAAHELQPCMDLNYKAATSGVMPIHRYLEDVAPDDTWGRMAEVGAIEGQRGTVRVLHDFWDASAEQSHQTLWKLPEGPHGAHIAAVTNDYHFSNDTAVRADNAIPSVRYKDTSRKKAPVSAHPQNRGTGKGQGSGYVLDKADMRRPAPRKISESNSSSSGDDDGKAKDADQDKPEEAKEPARRFEEDINEAKKGVFCVGLATSKTGKSPYIFVGRILKVLDREVTMTKYVCTGDPWTSACVAKKWYRVREQKGNTTSFPHYAIMAYGAGLTKANSLTAPMQHKVHERAIDWCQAD